MTIWSRPDVVVLGPGGIKGFYMLGALYEFECQNMFSNVKVWAGVSIGAIISLLIVVGYTSSEIIDIFLQYDIVHFIYDTDCNKDPQQHFSLFSSRPLRSVLEKLIREKIGMIPTLLQLYEHTHLNLTAVSLNLTEQRTEYISYFTHPMMNCIEAVLCSSNIPGIFDPILYNGNHYVDGALSNPYPIDAFDDGKTPILGIYISTDIRVDNTLSYISSNIDCTFFHMYLASRKNSSNQCRHFTISSYVNLLTATLNERKKMIEEGKLQASQFVPEEEKISNSTYLLKSTFLNNHVEYELNAPDVSCSAQLPPLKNIINSIVSSSTVTDDRVINALHTILECIRGSSEIEAKDTLEELFPIIQHSFRKKKWNP